MKLQQWIFLVDDDTAVRDAIKFLLETVGYQVASFSSAQAFLDAYMPDQPGCLLSDINMPGMDGLTLQQELLKRGIDIPTIFLTGHGDIAMAVAAMRKGAMHFLEKPVDDQLLLKCLAEALTLDALKRDEIVRKDTVTERWKGLTPREQEITLLVVKGLSNKEIARQLQISHRTVEIHRSRMMHKMQADSIPELVNMAMVCGIIEQPI